MTVLLTRIFLVTLCTLLVDLGIDLLDRHRAKAAGHTEIEPMRSLLARALLKAVLAGIIYGILLLILCRAL